MKKILCVILSLVFALSLVTTVWAQEENLWEVSSDGAVLYCEDREYYGYSIGGADVFNPESAYLYSDAIEINGEFLDLCVPKGTSEIVSVGYHSFGVFSPEKYYVTEKGRELLDDLYDGSYSFVRLQNYNGFSAGLSDMSLELLERLDSFEGETEDLDVRELFEDECYNVLVYDATDTIEHTHAGIFKKNSDFYYVNFDALDNSYFDSMGYFSFREGTVTALKLDGELKKQVWSHVTSAGARITEYEYADGYSFEPDEYYGGAEYFGESSGAAIFFWVFVLIIGFAAPLAAGITGICLALSKKPGRNKRWLVLPILSVVWMLAAVLIIVVLII